ncbi:MAG: hypothetical protein FWG40_12565, partial [Peptococcaceae bacterium]|nr:hypothetical protein [Peptococcaceae bacterium]
FTRGAIQYGAVGFIEGYAYSGITQAMTTGKVDHAEALTTATVSMLFAGVPGGFISKNVVKTSAVANVNKIRYAGSTESLKNLRRVNVRSSQGSGTRFPEDPNSLFPENYAGLTKTTKPDGKIIYDVQTGGKNYRIEYHPDHGGSDHFSGNHYHVKKQADLPKPGKEVPPYFRLPNLDPNTPAQRGGGTFAPGDLLPTKNK